MPEIQVTHLYCPMSGGKPGEDNTTHHLVPRAASQTCTYCKQTEATLREAARVATRMNHDLDRRQAMGKADAALAAEFPEATARYETAMDRLRFPDDHVRAENLQVEEPMNIRDTLVKYLSDEGLAEEKAGYGHASCDFLADKLLERFNISERVE